MTSSPHAHQRRIARKRRRALDDAERDALSLKIQRRLLGSAEFFNCSTIACYIAMRDEVDTSMIFDRAWRAGKSIYAPVTGRRRQLSFVAVERKTRLVRSAFGLWEPISGERISPRKLDLVVTPLVAFDAAGHRIGMGSGYYDTTFSHLGHRRHWLRTKLVGLAFNCQKIEKIAPNPWDIRLYRVITESA